MNSLGRSTLALSSVQITFSPLFTLLSPSAASLLPSDNIFLGACHTSTELVASVLVVDSAVCLAGVLDSRQAWLVSVNVRPIQADRKLYGSLPYEGLCKSVPSLPACTHGARIGMNHVPVSNRIDTNMEHI